MLKGCQIKRLNEREISAFLDLDNDQMKTISMLVDACKEALLIIDNHIDSCNNHICGKPCIRVCGKLIDAIAKAEGSL